MAQVGQHRHLVSLVGVITRGRPKVLVLSYCELGELLGVLRKKAADGSPYEMKPRLYLEIADGMAHLASLKLVHRDLAARNVLLASNWVAKVADFGLSRSVQDNSDSDYYRSAGGVLPVRWTAPEGFTEQKFSSASDVWSFAMTCVEILEDGRMPWPDTRSNPAVMAMVTGGEVHPQPRECDDELYDMLVTCWRVNPADRPTFPVLKKFFREHLAGPTQSTVPHSGRRALAQGIDNSVRKTSTNSVVIDPTNVYEYVMTSAQ